MARSHSVARALAHVVMLVGAAAGCSPRKPPAVTPSSTGTAGTLETIQEIKAFQETLGIEHTDDFLQYSAGPLAINRCYYTGKLELPASYRGLRLTQDPQADCLARGATDDVFFYPIEAVASGTAPVSPALVDASLDRLLMVVSHEDFHDQRETRNAPAETAEAAATLIGFLAASEFALKHYGPTAGSYQRLNRDAELFLQKARIVNLYYSQARDLYDLFRSGTIAEQPALARKAELFARLGWECSAISPEPASFNKCPAAMNNAGLAFDRTYTRDYPLVFGLYTLLGRDTTRTVAGLKRLLSHWPASATLPEDLLAALGEAPK
jgi:hypothetical protein